ncbi:MAG: transporter substrate-binding domain-containing protein [Gammaproteobacteria bacterium]|jgi:polar amino acid transport system substrate-binding protein|nr:transporter substrate-binding domain-containing protein [Gammaproteobacteria bacterium]MBU1468753.1 transporter substrate-binding domain-containing protein [Gammaproteobacteria bacterium]MBU2022830.1 transporter substrate-binding domain-containing protein [Gammaproteobacteria bacterium]MBU2238218.1 transporter substrate-binding domain-containing protein [Gammaproteobacteria bacterium]MBU2320963.1 transporter substrate-binding domain-containing protein [Gammaproteobacteria bacterium]
MRLHTHMVCCLLAVTFFNTDIAFAQDDLSSCASLTASGNSEYPPFLWRETSTSTELHGVNRLIIDELSRRIDIPIRLIHVGPWSRAQGEVKNGRVDLMAGAFYTNERADYMDYFTPVMLHTASVVWQRKDKPFSFSRKEDLVGKWGVTVINNSFGQEFDQYAQHNLNILAVASLSQALRMLAADRVDYVLYEKNPAHAYATMLGLSDAIIPVLPYISSEGLYLTMSKKSPCNVNGVKRKIAIALQEMKQEGFTEQAVLDGVQEWEARSRAGITLK